MEFWSAEVKPSKKYTGKVEDGEFLHISNAALASATDKAVLKLRLDQGDGDKEIVICTLTPEKCDQVPLDLVLDRPFTLTHTSSTGSIHLTGYKTEPDFEGEFEDDSEEEEEDIVPVPPPASEVKPKASKAPKENGKLLDVKDSGKKANELVKATRKPGDDDDSEDDSDDSDESDDEFDGEMGLYNASDDTLDGEGFSDGDSDEDSDENSDEIDEMDDEEDEDDDDDEELPLASNKKRAAEALAITPPSEKKIKTPSGKAVKSESKADLKAPQIKTPKTPKEEKKSEKKSKKETPKATPSTDVKSKGTPGTDAKSGGKLGKYYCDPCSRNFVNESAYTQHNSAKHKK